MTTPRDDIAGLSERLRANAACDVMVAPKKLLSEAATQLDSLLKERDALQARVKELDAVEIDARLAMLDVARLQQERDEAYEMLKPLASGADALWSSLPDQFEVIVRIDATPLFSLKAGDIRAAGDLIRRLAAGPEKEKKE